MPAKKNRRAAQDVSRASNLLPRFFAPMMAQRANQLPEGDGWTYELKLDGYRALLFKDGARVSLRSRNDKDLAIMYPSIVADGGRLKANQAIVDGEIVAVDQLGRPSFQALQRRGSHPKHTVVFYAFDLPYIDGTSDEMKDIRWVNPRLVAQIRFIEWTHEGRLRHAKFLGLRFDKNPKTVRREE